MSADEIEHPIDDILTIIGRIETEIGVSERTSRDAHDDPDFIENLSTQDASYCRIIVECGIST